MQLQTVKPPVVYLHVCFFVFVNRDIFEAVKLKKFRTD